MERNKDSFRVSKPWELAAKLYEAKDGGGELYPCYAHNLIIIIWISIFITPEQKFALHLLWQYWKLRKDRSGFSLRFLFEIHLRESVPNNEQIISTNHTTTFQKNIILPICNTITIIISRKRKKK